MKTRKTQSEIFSATELTTPTSVTKNAKVQLLARLRDTKKVSLSESECEQRETVLRKRLQEEVGVGFFLDLLQDATDAMLDAVEAGEVHRSDLFRANGQLTPVGRRYAEGALSRGINPRYLGNCCDGMFETLTFLLGKKTFDFFEADRNDESRFGGTVIP